MSPAAQIVESIKVQITVKNDHQGDVSRSLTSSPKANKSTVMSNKEQQEHMWELERSDIGV